MRDWPEPDQDTALDILETWDPGDYEEARAERYYDEMAEEIARSEEAEVNAQDDDNPYADWEPNTCHCGNTNGCYCQSMADEALGRHEDDMDAYYQKMMGKHSEESDKAKLNADATNARADILQAKTNIARIKADIALFKSQIAYNNYNGYLPVNNPPDYTDAENQLVKAEANLVEAKTVLVNARRIGAAHTAVVEAYNYVKYAEAKVEIKKDAKNRTRTIEFEEIFNSKFPDDESDSLVENDHIEFVNALIELAEAKDALDLAKTLLAKTLSEKNMDIINGFEFKQRKYMPVFPKANGKTTVYIGGYPCENDEHISATNFHGEHTVALYDQFKRYFAINEQIYVGIDSFIYYSEGDTTKCVAPDIYIVFGVAKYPLRRSFYTWAEGAAPVAVFEFLSDATARQDRTEKVGVYLKDIGVQEYFVHQPDVNKPEEFRGWRRDPSGGIVEMEPDAEGVLFSEALNLYLRCEEQHRTHVRLLRPYMLDLTPITTSLDEHYLKKAAEARVEEEALRRQQAEAELEKLRAQLAQSQRS